MSVRKMALREEGYSKMKCDHFAKSHEGRWTFVEKVLTPGHGMGASPNARMSYLSGLKGIKGKYGEF